MKSLCRITSVVALMVLTAEVALASECSTYNGYDGKPIFNSIYVANQTDADAKLGNCTTIRGDLYIESRYTGSLNITTITNITGYIYAQSAGLTSLSLDNLLYADELRLINYGNFTSLSLSQLTKVKLLWVSSRSPINLLVPSLVNAPKIQLTGNYSNLDFSGLVNANITLNSAGYRTNGFAPISISFPSLKVSDTFELYGNIIKMFVPQFQTAKSIEISSPAPLNFTFPSLTSSDKITLANIASLSLPSLVSSKAISVTVFSPTKVSFPALINGENIDIHGNVTNVLLPVLKYCHSSLYVYSDIKVDCSSSKEAYNRVLAQEKADSVSSSQAPYYTCSQKTVWDEDAFERNHRLSMYLGFGLGMGLPLFIILSILCWVFWKRYTYRRDNRPNHGGYESDGSDDISGGITPNAWKKRKLDKERERAAKLATKQVVLDAQKEERQAAMRKKIKVMHRMEENDEAEADLGVFKLQDQTTPSHPPPSWAPSHRVEIEDEEEHYSDDPPPSYDWEGGSSASRFHWEARNETGESSGSGGAGASAGGGRSGNSGRNARANSRWRDGGDQFTEEETELLKGSRG